MFRRENSQAQGYLVAIGATVIVACVCFFLADVLKEIPPFVPFVIPVILAGWCAGLRPGLLATFLGGLSALYFLTNSDWLQRVAYFGIGWRLLFFAIFGSTVSVICESWHAARRRLQAEHQGLEETQAALRRSEARLAAELEALGRLRELTNRLPLCPDLTTAAHEILDALISLHGAEMGNLQLYNAKAGVLEIVAQRGLPQAFLDHFRTVSVDDDSAGGRALRSGTRVIVEDVDADPRYQAHRDIAAIAGYRAVQSTPLLSRVGEPLGMLSTHFRAPHRPSERDLWVIDLYARQAADYIERIRGEDRLQQRVEENEHLMESLKFLAEASATLTALVDNASTLQLVARLAVPRFADWCLVDILDSSGVLRRLTAAHADSSKAELSFQYQDRYPPDPRLGWGAANVARTGEPELMSVVPDSLLEASVRDEEHLRFVRTIGIKSYISVPILVRDKLFGVLSFILSGGSRRFGPDDLRLAQDLARRAAIAIENSRLYSELKEAGRRKDEFLATLAHELRNPLAPIRNGLELLSLAEGDLPLQQGTRGVMERQLQQMVRLIDDLLDVSRINRGKVQVRKEQVELTAIVRSAVETARPLIVEKAHELTVTLPSRAVHLNADPTRLAQVFSNLLNNAAKYTEAGGRIEVTAVVESEKTVALTVADSGIGIESDQLAHVFEMFSQTAPALERSQGGLGIGLAIVRGLVELHGGSVNAESDGPGTGSRFVVRLPVIEVPIESLPSTIDGALMSARKRRILVVDDNRDAADSLALILQRMGHELSTAYDGQEGVEAVARFQPEVVLLDIGLPKLNGYEAAREIRRQPTGKEVELIAITGWGQEEDKRRAFEAGFDHHLTKPVEASVLRKLLAESCAVPGAR